MGGLRFLGFLLVVWAFGIRGCEALGMNYGIMAIHPLPMKIVVQMLRDNGITKVKLFDVDRRSMEALVNSDIEVMVAILDNMLEKITGSLKVAKEWVSKNVSRNMFNVGINIKYVTVGNEPFLSSYNDSYVAGEIGWSTNGNKYANASLAQKFYQGLLKHILSDTGTSKRPRKIEAYLLGLLNDDAKSVNLTSQGQNINLVAAKNVQYLTQKWCVYNTNAAVNNMTDLISSTGHIYPGMLRIHTSNSLRRSTLKRHISG